MPSILDTDFYQKMIEIAEGDKLKFLQEDIKFRGYAIEFRINAEDPQKNFMPSVGKITNYMTPGGPGVRLDSAAYMGYTIPSNYDSMIGKLIVWAIDWKGAVKKAKRALGEFYLEGFPTNIPLHREILRDKDFIEGYLSTNYLEKKLDIFNLHVIDALAEEDKKISNITNLIKTINSNKIKARH